jgi:hypothetical protein
MKGVKKMISILLKIISIARMKLLMLPKAKKPDHFACKMGLLTCTLLKFLVFQVEMKQMTYPLPFCNSTPSPSLLASRNFDKPTTVKIGNFPCNVVATLVLGS